MAARKKGDDKAGAAGAGAAGKKKGAAGGDAGAGGGEDGNGGEPGELILRYLSKFAFFAWAV